MPQPMRSDAIEDQKREVSRRFGEWKAHNIRLEGDVYTIGPEHHPSTTAEQRLESLWASLDNTRGLLAHAAVVTHSPFAVWLHDHSRKPCAAGLP